MADFVQNFVKNDMKEIKIERNGKMFKLRPFETKTVFPKNSRHCETEIFINPGAPVISFAWYNARVNDGDLNCYHFAAVGTSLCDKETDLNKKHSGKGLIQIWKFSKSGKPAESSLPAICFAFATDHKLAFDLTWLDKRHIPAQFCEKNPEKTSVFPSFLGVCSGDGKFRLYSVPFSFDRFDLAAAVPTLAPLLVLSGGDDAIVWKTRFGGLMATQTSFECYPLLGASTCGELLVWDLKTVKDSNAETFPVKQWQGHKFPSLIRAIEWHRTNPFVFLSGGTDNLIKIWDVRFTKQPLQLISAISEIFEAVWSPNPKPEIIFAKEKCNNTSIKIYSLGERVQKNPFFVLKCRKPVKNTVALDCFSFESGHSLSQIRKFDTFVAEGRDTGHVYLYSMNRTSFGDIKYAAHKIQIIANNHVATGEFSSEGPAVRSEGPSEEKTEKKKIAKWKTKAFETAFLGDREPVEENVKRSENYKNGIGILEFNRWAEKEDTVWLAIGYRFGILEIVIKSVA